MRTVKKAISLLTVFFVAAPLFAIRIDQHVPSKQAQQKLNNQLMTLMKAGKYKEIDDVVNKIPHCFDVKASYKENEKLPTVCYAYGDVIEVNIESVASPGTFVRKEYISTVNPDRAFLLAMDAAFAWEGNTKYWDYNKMIAAYKQGGPVFKNKINYFLEKKDIYTQAAFVFLIGDKSAEKSFAFEFYRDSNWNVYGIVGAFRDVATNIYKDKNTYYKVRWGIFSNILKATLVGKDEITAASRWFEVMTYPEFWAKVAFMPSDQKQKEWVLGEVRKIYNACVKQKFDRCSDFKISAEKKGFWKETAAERQKKIEQEMRGYIATQPKM